MAKSPHKLHFLITAGPTREYVDPVRFISNASSGRMGYALARAAISAGHKVTLIAGMSRAAVKRGLVSITPLKLDFTDNSSLERFCPE